MALAKFKDLCIDASDATALGLFWGYALGLRVDSAGDPDTVLRGPTAAHTIWVNQVPEPKAVKNRVHLDIHTGDVAALTAAGAVLAPRQGFRWTVLSDPDGQEFCAFLRDPVPDTRLYEIAVDCVDPEAQATWWGEVFGTAVSGGADKGCWWLDPLPDAPFESFTFVSVPEPKTTKNRVHWDVTCPDGSAALLAAGATTLRASTEGPAEDHRVWDVLADPEGNEFCVFPA